MAPAPIKTPKWTGITPKGTPRTPVGAVKASQISFIVVFCLELILCAVLILRSPDGNPLNVTTRGRRLVESFPRKASINVPVIPDVAPEYGFFTVNQCTDFRCGGALNRTESTTFIHALQMCLGAAPDCTGVLFDPIAKRATLCEALLPPGTSTSGSSNSLGSTSRSLLRKSSSSSNNRRHLEGRYTPGDGSTIDCNISGQRKVEEPPHPCPGLRSQCLVLESLELQSGFNDQAQLLMDLPAFKELWDGPPMNFRAYNPALVDHDGEWFAAIRISNWTFCPGVEKPMNRLRASPGDGVHSTTAICKIHMPLATIQLETCQFMSPMAEDKLVLTKNASLSWSIPHLVGKGLEDLRPFVHQGKLRLSGNRRHLIDGMEYSKFELEQIKVKGKEASIVVDVELDEDFDHLARDPHGIECEVESGNLLQKNWMPLSDGNELFYVTRLEPLTVVKVSIGRKSNTCKLVYQRTGVMPSYDARTFKGGLRGGSTFIKIDNSTFFGLAHSRLGIFTYHHHFIVLRRSAKDQFELEWVSEAFRLPRSPQLLPVGSHQGIQFSMSVARFKDDLYISYGDGDCDANIAIEPDYFKKLEYYMRHGLATHKLQWTVNNKRKDVK